MGTVPEVTPLAKVIMSGSTPKTSAAKRRAHAPERGDHLVEDEQDAVLLRDLAQALQVALRRDEHAGRAGHGLDDHRGDGGGVVQRDQALELVGEVRALLGLPARERVLLRQCVCGRWSTPAIMRAEHLAVGDDAAHRDAAEAHAVVAALAADEARARAFAAHALVGERDLQRGVDGLGARVAEEDVVERVRARARRCGWRARRRAGWPIWNAGE